MIAVQVYCHNYDGPLITINTIVRLGKEINIPWPSSIANFSLETEVVIRMSGRVNDRMRFSLIRLLKVTVY